MMLSRDGAMRASAASKHIRAEELPSTVTAAPTGTAVAASATAMRVLPMLMIQVLLGIATIAEKGQSRHQLVTLHRVAQLVVAEAQRSGGSALIPAAFFQRGREDRLLIFGD